MAYDDNDFQSQNFQLGGEDSSKFQSGLRLFTLPKFCLDEHLQSHLRFDSLVGSGDLLRIPVHEDSNWIEEYSPGHSVIKFSSTATESGSRSRRKNVWSEATSSKSVDMILRSIEEDVLMENMTSTDAVVHDVIKIKNTMDTSPNKNCSNHIELGAVGNSESAVQFFQSHSGISGVKEDALCPEISTDQNIDQILIGERSESIKKADPVKSAKDYVLLGQPSDSGNCMERASLQSRLGHLPLALIYSGCHISSDFGETSHISSPTRRLEIHNILPSSSITEVSVYPHVPKSANLIRREHTEDLIYEASDVLTYNQGKPTHMSLVEKQTDGDYATDSNIDTSVNTSCSKILDPSLLSTERCIESSYSKTSDDVFEVIVDQMRILTDGNAKFSQIVSAKQDKSYVFTEISSKSEVDMVIENADASSISVRGTSSLADGTTFNNVDLPTTAVSDDDKSLPVHVASESGNCQIESDDDKQDDCPLVAKVDDQAIDQSDQSDVRKLEKHASDVHELLVTNKIPHVENDIAMITKETSNDAQMNAKQKSVDTSIYLEKNVAEVSASSTEDVRSIQLCQTDALGSASRGPGCGSNSIECIKLSSDVVLANPDCDLCVSIGKLDDDINQTPDTSSQKLSDGPPQRDNVQDESGITVLDSIDGSRDMKQSDGAVNNNSLEVSIFPASDPDIPEQGVSIIKEIHDESHSLKEGHAIADSPPSTCGSPAIISCSECSHDETKHFENLKVSSNQTLSESNDIFGASTNKDEDLDPKSANDTVEEVNICEDDINFTFEVGQISEISVKDSNGWKSFCTINPFQDEQETPVKLTSPGDFNLSKKSSHGSQLVHEDGKISNKSNGNPKSRSTTTGAVASKCKLTREKALSKKTAERIQTPQTIASISFGNVIRDAQLEEMRQHSPVDGGDLNTSSSPHVQTSDLPDLNTATASLFSQPFNDLQQVQLRAQIFVYGSLIQGVPPDEACMVSAFGDTGCGRGTWESVWCAVAEKFQIQRSPVAGCETPVSRSANKVLDQIPRSTPVQSNVLSTPPSRVGNKVPPSTVYSSMPLPSPLQGISSSNGLHSSMPMRSHLDHNQILSPLHIYQSPHARPYASSGPWLTSPTVPVPWGASSHASSADTNMQLSASPFVGTAQLTSVNYTSTSKSSSVTFSSAFPANDGTTGISKIPLMQFDANRDVSSGTAKVISANKKSHRKKRSTVVAEPDSSAGVSRPLSTTPANPSSRDSSSVHPSNVLAAISPTHFQIISGNQMDPKITFSGEICSKVELAKLQAEDAAALAAAAVRHSEGMWSQLASKMNSGINTEVECKLASAAVAAAAAASVAKAAAAAAKLAADAAMQAKLMADEALLSGSGSHSSNIDGSNSSKVTPVPTFNNEFTYGSYSKIPAREAARRVEAKSSAAKRAENLDAMVKAAELVADAVAQAGAIAAMGDPLPLTLHEIIEAGPCAYWKIQNSTAEQKPEENQPVIDAASGHDCLVSHFILPSSNKNKLCQAAEQEISLSNDIIKEATENYQGDASGIASSVNDVENVEKVESVIRFDENRIQEGTLVEVMSDAKGLRDVWYAAHVMNLKDSEVYIRYNEILTDEGSEKLEWISFNVEGEKVPRIRIAHPMTMKKPEGARKRRRAAVGTYTWAVGDRVDVWIGDGWREGVITEKSKEDETKMTINFPVGSDELSARSWDLRPTLVWEGQWVEWSCSRSNASQHHEDTPQEKRQKLSKPESEIHSEAYALGGGSRNLLSDELKNSGEIVPLALSSKEKTFSLGKMSMEENNPQKIKRVGLQKEGSKVVFGVPRPGKKRKFMDVSKQCVVRDAEKAKEASDTMKLAKYSMPQTSNNGWKIGHKVGPGSKRAPDWRPKLMKSAKSLNVQVRSVADKGGSSLLSASGAVGTNRDNLAAKYSSRHVENRSFPNKIGMTDGSLLSSHLHTGIETLPTDKPMSDHSEHVERGKNVRAGEKLSRAGDISGKPICDSSEPRRSNRKIQPTSRLLEGLQSSLIISKLPNASHRIGSSSRGNAGR